MSELTLEVSTGLRQAVQTLATALRETPAFARFEKAALQFQNDEMARQTIAELQSKQQALQAMIMLNALNAEDRAELERLERAVYASETIKAYIEAQDELANQCLELNDYISQSVGMRFAVRQGGCCG
jgi:cell fate (sporulation/competence/biofilm development) regulator YlbF (YheA/YmcA/DUF963 family)